MKRWTQWQSWWQARLPRERSVLLVGAVFCSAALLYWTLAALAGLRERAEYTRDREQRVLWRMQRRSEELLRLKALAPLARLSAGPLQSATANLLQRHGLPPALLQAQADGNSLQLSGQVPFERWATWLTAAQLELGLVVRHAQIEAGEAPGLVKLTVELALRESTP